MKEEQISNAKIYNNKFYNLEKVYSVLVNRGAVNIDIFENDLFGGVNVASIEDIVKIYDNNIYGGEVKADLIGWNINDGYTINKVIVEGNKIDNSFIFANKVKDILIMNNEINYDKLYINCSNSAIYNNKFTQNTNIRFKLENNENNQKYDFYFLNNYSGNMNSYIVPDIEDINLVTLYEKENEIEKYIEKFK